ncbi:MAG: hypothetical protein WAT09_13220 [Paracoccaceae bacterium]
MTRIFEVLALRYYESDAWHKLKPRTKSDYRKYIQHIRAIWGDKAPQTIETHHIFALHQANRGRWRQANYGIQVLVVLLNHARLIGVFEKAHGKSAHGIPLVKRPGEGWEQWPDDLAAGPQAGPAEEYDHRAIPVRIQR